MASGEQYIFDIEHQPPIALDQLFGLDDAKQTIRSIVSGCVQAELMEKYGGKRATGVFLDGGPGTGKSTLVRAMTHEVGAATGEGADLLTITASAIYRSDKPEYTMQRAFDQARGYEGWGVLFFNEADGLLSRSKAGTESRVTAICKDQLERVTEDNPHLLVAAATNNIHVIDPAIYASHRFNSRLNLSKPDIRVLTRIMQQLMKETVYGRPDLPVFVPHIDAESLLSSDLQFNGGHLVEVVRRAKELKILETARTGIEPPGQVTEAELDAIIKQYKNEGTS